MNRFREWLGLERNITVMLVSILILGMGEELWRRFIPKYLSVLGAGTLIISLYGTLNDFLDAVYQYPGGWIADKLGRRAALVIFAVLTIIGCALYISGDNWIWIFVGTLFTVAWGSLTLPAIFAIIGDNLAQNKRAIGFGVQSILKRIPIVIAPAIGGFIIIELGLLEGLKIGFLMTMVLGIFAIFIVLKYFKETHTRETDTLSIKNVWNKMNTQLKRLLISDCLARIAEGIPKVFIILYVVDVLKSSEFEFGWLTGIQMLTAIIVYIPIAKIADRMNRKPFVVMTFIFFALFPLTLALSQNLIWLIFAFIVAGLREIGEPARKALIVDLAGETTRARTVGLYYLIRGLIVFPASLIGGYLWSVNTTLPFYTAFAVGTAGVLVYSFYTKTD
ncbi:MAG: MFS transporter [Planctomycetes bacterium]|nr:MFS transporter [Planctomycetota bacterium]